MIHKKILDVASEQPDASLDDIAAQVSSANTDLVERVLDEYGDPADTPPPDDPANTPPPDDPADTPPENTESATRDSPELPSRSEVTEKQRKTLRAIYDHPDASQQEIADLLDVTAPTISRRVNTIEGFDWSDRHAIATAILDSTPSPDTDRPTNPANETLPSPDDETPPATDTPAMSQNATTREPLEELAERITTLEQQLETTTSTPAEEPLGGNTELLHKIIHACMESETITQDEELQIIEQLLQ